MLEAHHIDKHFVPRLEKRGIILYLETGQWERERFSEGKFFLKTKLSEKEISTEQAVRIYKELQSIERAFREMKDFLKIRPIFHWTDRRVKAHVMICVLAYLLEKMVELSCQKACLNLSARRALYVLGQLKAIQVKLGDQSIRVTTEIDKKMKEIMDALGVPLPEKVIENQVVR